MASTVTLATMVAKARLFADMRPGGAAAHITDTEVEGLINGALQELYDLLVSAGGHEYYETVDTSLATVSGTATVTLPASFYRLLSLHLVWGTDDLEEVDSIDSLSEQHRYRNYNQWARETPKGYRIRGTGSTQYLEFFPTPNAATSLELRYVPAFTLLTNVTPGTTDIFDGVNGWDKLVELTVAVEMRTLAGRPASFIIKQRDEQRDRIEALAHQRDALNPPRIRDVDHHYEAARSWRRLGPVP